MIISPGTITRPERPTTTMASRSAFPAGATPSTSSIWTLRRTRPDSTSARLRTNSSGPATSGEGTSSAPPMTLGRLPVSHAKLLMLSHTRSYIILICTCKYHSFPDELNQFFANLTALTELAYRSNGNTPVVILTHSMGSVAAHHWLTRKVDQAWKDRCAIHHLGRSSLRKSSQIVRCLPDTSAPSSPSPARGRGP